MSIRRRITDSGFQKGGDPDATRRVMPGSPGKEMMARDIATAAAGYGLAGRRYTRRSEAMQEALSATDLNMLRQRFDSYVTAQMLGTPRSATALYRDIVAQCTKMLRTTLRDASDAEREPVEAIRHNAWGWLEKRRQRG